VDLEPQLREVRCVPERVREPQLVADVGVEGIQGVAGFEVTESDVGDEVAPPDDEEDEIDEVVEEGQTGRQRSDDDDARNGEELEAPEHGCAPSRSLRRVGRQ